VKVPRVSVWLIRTACVHLLSGAILGALYLVFKATTWPLFVVSHRPVHIEQMLMGWLVQLVIGVAYWILPRGQGQDPSASGGVMWWVYGLLNGGLLLAALGGDPALPASLVLAGRIAETMAVALFGLHAWNRQRPYRQAARRLIV
jgi:hypothetical protein